MHSRLKIIFFLFHQFYSVELLNPHLVVFLDLLGQLLNGKFEPACADDVLQELQHSCVVLGLSFGFHQRNRLDLALKCETNYIEICDLTIFRILN